MRKRVKGKEYLVRDDFSSAIINTAGDALERARRAKKERVEQSCLSARLNTLEDKVTALSDGIEKILKELKSAKKKADKV
jgi:hypothetical protein